MIHLFTRCALDMEEIFVLTVIFLIMLLIFKFIKNRKVLLAILSIFLLGITACEILYRTWRSMGPQMLALALQYLFIPGSLAIITWLVIRRVRQRK